MGVQNCLLQIKSRALQTHNTPCFFSVPGSQLCSLGRSQACDYLSSATTSIYSLFVAGRQGQRTTYISQFSPFTMSVLGPNRLSDLVGSAFIHQVISKV